ncbi:MAG: hypothetical protein H6861_02495 [Rhodospirillales bacterium]|nr:hypothetical protein [Rhodospirillales bacterium]
MKQSLFTLPDEKLLEDFVFVKNTEDPYVNNDIALKEELAPSQLLLRG